MHLSPLARYLVICTLYNISKQSDIQDTYIERVIEYLLKDVSSKSAIQTVQSLMSEIKSDLFLHQVDELLIKSQKPREVVQIRDLILTDELPYPMPMMIKF